MVNLDKDKIDHLIEKFKNEQKALLPKVKLENNFTITKLYW